MHVIGKTKILDHLDYFRVVTGKFRVAVVIGHIFGPTGTWPLVVGVLR